MKEKHSLGKRLAAMGLALAVGLGSLGIGVGRTTALAASDAPAWASNAMDKMSELGVIRGDADGQMHANRAVTRAEFISMLNRAFNYTNHSGGDLPFEDMTGEEWYADNIRVAYEQGYFSGISETSAGATKAINREEATSLLCRNLKIDTKELLLDQFTDGRNISRWARPTVGAAVDKGYMSGYSDGSFRPQRNISRAEAAVVLSNSLGTMLTAPGDYTFGTLSGNVTISSSDVVLYDTVIAGDLYITEGVGTGFLGLSNVTVLGEVIVCGGGEGNWGGNSVTLENCTINKLTADGPAERPLALNAIGTTAVNSTNVKSNAYLENSPDTEIGFSNVVMDAEPDEELHLSGYFNVVEVKGPQNGLTLGKGSIGNLVVDEDAVDSIVVLDRDTNVDNMRIDSASTINGRGDVETAYVTTAGVSIEMLPNQIEIRPGVVTNINGKEMGSLDGEESSDEPRILSGYPKTDELAQNATKMMFSTNKPGTIYWGLSYKEIDAPTEDQLLKPATVAQFKQKGSISVAESRKEDIISIGGLETDVQYTLYAVLKDDHENVSNISKVTFRTPNNTVPGFVAGYPKAVGRTSESLDILAMTTKDAAVYWVVMPQGAVAPTVRQMRNEEYEGDIAHGHRNNCKKNAEYSFTVDDLEELVVYDIYVMATDGINDSAVVKLTGTTKDTTPPEFTPTTPRQDKVQDTTVDVKVGTTENATLYYVVCERGTAWPVPIPPAVEPPDLDSDEAKEAILTANNAMISGRVNVQVGQEATVQIRGLQPETSYDCYMALADAAGNVSTIKKIVIKTRDVIPPTAEMYFPDDIEGRPQVENEIHIVFSEEVWNRLTNAPMVPDTADTEENVSLKNLFVLYDRTNGKNDETVRIDFTKVRIEEGEKAATIVVFPPDAFINQDGGRGLTSGSRYQFELSNIVDTSGNAMKQKTLLEEFQTTPPLVQLTRTENEESVDKTKIDYLDATFTIEPQSNKTADSVLYDMIFESDTTISFELYYREFGSTANFQPLAISGLCDLSGSSMNTAYVPRIVVSPGQTKGAISLHYIIDRQIEGNENFHYEKFSTLKPGEYGIRVTSIGSDSGRGGWNKTVNMAVRCVVGSRTNLNAIAPNPIPSVVDPAVESGNVSLVNYPLTFNLMLPFTDTIVPKFVDPYPLLYPPAADESLEDALIADILIRPQVVADRAATMYYLIAPVNGNKPDGQNTVDPLLKEVQKDITIKPGDANNPPVVIKGYTFEQDNLDDCLGFAMLSGDKVPSGGIYGTWDIKNTTMHQDVIEGLEPEKYYDIFMVLKGTPAEPSHVWHRRFQTTKIAPPVLDIKGMTAGDGLENITIRSDKLADIVWIAYPEQALKDFLMTDPDNPAREIVKPELKDQVTNMIISGQEGEIGGERPVDSGSGVAAFGNTNEYLLQTQVKNITRGTYYKLIGIAKARLSNGTPIGEYSEILVSTRFTPRDTTPPTYAVNINGVEEKPEASGFYDGRITIVFSEPLFYRPMEGAPWQPVADANTFFSMLSDPFGLTVVNSVFADVPIEGADGSTTTAKALQSITMSFTGKRDGDIIYSLRELCDASGNALGQFEIKFEGLADKIPKPPETPDPPTDTTRTLFSNRGQQTVQTFGTAMNPPRVVTGISAVSAINRGGDYSGVVTVTFNGKVFYRDVDGSFQPISNVTTLMDGLEMYGSGIITGATESSFTAYSNLPDGTQASGKTLSTAKLRFSDVQEGDRLVCTMTLYDTDGKVLNGFTLDFVDMENRAGANTGFSQARQQSRWELQ